MINKKQMIDDIKSAIDNTTNFDGSWAKAKFIFNNLQVKHNYLLDGEVISLDELVDAVSNSYSKSAEMNKACQIVLDDITVLDDTVLYTFVTETYERNQLGDGSALRQADEANIIRCPYCGQSHYSVETSQTTLVNYTPVYKDEVLVDRDNNITTKSCHCSSCDKDFILKSSVNGWQVFKTEEIK